MKNCIDNFEDSYLILFRKWGFESTDLRDDVLVRRIEHIMRLEYIFILTYFFSISGKTNKQIFVKNCELLFNHKHSWRKTVCMADEFRVIKILCNIDWNFKKIYIGKTCKVLPLKTGHSTVVYEVLGRWTSCAGGNFRSTYLPHT